MRIYPRDLFAGSVDLFQRRAYRRSGSSGRRESVESRGTKENEEMLFCRGRRKVLVPSLSTKSFEERLIRDWVIVFEGKGCRVRLFQ